FDVDGTRTSVALNNLDLTDGTGWADNAAGTGPVVGQGGAIWNGGTLTLSACNLFKNSCRSSSAQAALGGAISNAGTLKVINSTLHDNTAGGQDSFDVFGGNGGAIYNTGSLTVINSVLDDNLPHVGSGGGSGAAT